jgi:hypothetical protein
MEADACTQVDLQEEVYKNKYFVLNL